MTTGSAAVVTLRPPEGRISEIQVSREHSEPSLAVRFRALYDAEVAFVWRNLRRLGVVTDVEDRTQEVFVVAYRRFAEFRDLGFGPRAWLFQIVYRVAAEARRHRRRHPEDTVGAAALDRQSIEADQAHVLARRQELARLDRALDRLDINRRTVLVLHDIEEMSAPAVAEILQIPVNTVYSRLRVARAELEWAFRTETRPGIKKGGGA